MDESSVTYENWRRPIVVGCWWLSSVVVDGASEWEKNLGGGVSAIQAVMVVSGRTEVSDGRLIRGTTEKIVSRNGRIVPGTSGKTVKFEKVKKRAAVVDRVF
ncbi:hypothetical protein LXL04_028807 [Taraxacum kok-saghyz]